MTTPLHIAKMKLGSAERDLRAMARVCSFYGATPTRMKSIAKLKESVSRYKAEVKRLSE